MSNFYQKNYLVILFTFFLIPSINQALPVHSPSGKSTENLFRPGGNTLFEGVRANAPHFWAWASENRAVYFKANELIVGEVSGDPHVLNFAYAYINQSYQFSLVDVDDLGRAPLLVDLVRFLVSSQALNDQISLDQIILSYEQGLNGKIPTPLAFLKNEYINPPSFKLKQFLKRTLLSKAPQQYQDLYQKVEADFLKALGITKPDEVRFYKKNSGGSQGMPRFLIRFKKTGQDQIQEFKMLDQPASQNWKTLNKSAPTQTFNFNNTVYRPNPDDEFELITTSQGDFLKRPSWQSSQLISDLVETHPRSNNLFQYTLFTAQYLGFFQSKQPEGKQWQTILQADHAALVKNIKQLVQDYLFELDRLGQYP